MSFQHALSRKPAIRRSTPRKESATGLALTAGLASPALAADIDVEITNLTNSMYFTPLLVAAHDDSIGLFEVAMPASTALTAMAEGGAIDDLVAELDAAGAVSVANPAAGLLGPVSTTTASFDTGALGRLSIVAMVLPTNDGFADLDG